ncbi:hypothetical protein M885DRAFT_439393, partial [Pelagophyceae sp. CCMP2097]
VAQARLQWEGSINDELEAIARERHVPLARTREGEAAPPARADPSAPLRFLFDSDDLLDAIAHIESARPASGATPPLTAAARGAWGVLKLQLPTPALAELRVAFADLHWSKRQYGVDETSRFADSDRFVAEWHDLGKRCAAHGHVPAVRRYARRGVPPGLRAALWRVLLGLPEHVSAAERAYYARLRAHVDSVELVTDELFQMDVHHVGDSDYYFPFEEPLRNVVLAFSRDGWVLDHSAAGVGSGAALAGTMSKKQHRRDGAEGCVPPCAVQPYRGFVHYAAPLTFLYTDEEPIYFALRAMYCRHWCKLNVLRTKAGTLLPLCKLFENLLLEQHARLFFHLVQIGVEPLSIALPWIQFGFVTILDVAQVLLLWDRLLGFDDLRLLPVLAAAIFVYRSKTLLTATTPDEAKEMFADGSTLDVAPLLQHFLFSSGRLPPHAAEA